MTTSLSQCPKCNARMQQGFVLDNTHGARLPEGDLIPIGTYRCSSCGYLESYACEEFAAK